MLWAGLCVWTEDIVFVRLSDLDNVQTERHRIQTATLLCRISFSTSTWLRSSNTSVRRSGLYIILSHVFRVFSWRAYPEDDFIWFHFLWQTCRDRKGFLVLFFFLSNDPTYREPMCKMKVWMSGENISCPTLPFSCAKERKSIKEKRLDKHLFRKVHCEEINLCQIAWGHAWVHNAKPSEPYEGLIIPAVNLKKFYLDEPKVLFKHTCVEEDKLMV